MEEFIEPEYHLGFFSPGDAPGVVRLFQIIYGDFFPVQAMYDPAEIIGRNADGSYHALVAKNDDGEVIGHIAVFRSNAPNPDIFEAGLLMVRPDFRQTGVAFSLFSALVHQLIPATHITSFWGEAVCNHLFTQQMAVREGFIEMALEMDLMPAESYTTPHGQSVGGRVSVLPIFYLASRVHQTIYLPARYEAYLRFLYSPLEDSYSFDVSAEGLPPGMTSGEVIVLKAAKVARITIHTVGEDIRAWVKKTEAQVIAEGAVIIQWYLHLSWPCIGSVTDLLFESGSFFGGVLPAWFGSDALLMQKVIGKPYFEGTHVYSKRAKKIKEYVMNDWYDQSGDRTGDDGMNIGMNPGVRG